MINNFENPGELRRVFFLKYSRIPFVDSVNIYCISTVYSVEPGAGSFLVFHD